MAQRLDSEKRGTLVHVEESLDPYFQIGEFEHGIHNKQGSDSSIRQCAKSYHAPRVM